MQRLQKLIATAGYCSRRQAEQLIETGKVKVNGEVISELGRSFPDDVTIEVEGQILNLNIDKVYYLLNKPRNTIATVRDDRSRQTVIDLLDIKQRVFPVGRLDYDTTGALLLTNDGELTNYLIHPRYEIEKEYIVSVKGNLDIEKITILKEGVTYEGQILKAKAVEIVKYNKKQNHTIIKLTLTEGKNRQVRNMFTALGYEVVKLNRESFAGLSTKGLRQGEFRLLKDSEIQMLKSLAKR